VFILSTLWVTSLTILSARPNATAMLADAGANLLNPFLVGHGDLGLSQTTYTRLEASARAHPSQPITLPVLKVRVLGREIVGKSYAGVVELVYSRVAEGYYDGGTAAVFDVPSQLQAVLPNFALFNPNNIPLVPGGPTPAQLPVFLQPFVTFVGLTPDTLTAAGHQKILNLLPWFWIALVALGVLAVLLNHSEQKLMGLAKGTMHGAWPVVAILLLLWVLSLFFSKPFMPYIGMLGLISRAFLPVYGTAFAVGLIGVIMTRVLASRNTSGDTKAKQDEAVKIPESIAANTAHALR
jgi:hypothetical protein